MSEKLLGKCVEMLQEDDYTILIDYIKAEAKGKHTYMVRVHLYKGREQVAKVGGVLRPLIVYCDLGGLGVGKFWKFGL